MSREVLLLVDALAREKSVAREVVFAALESALTDGERPDEPVRWRLRSDALSSVSNAPAPGDGGSGVVSADSYRAVETPCAAYPPLVS